MGSGNTACINSLAVAGTVLGAIALTLGVVLFIFVIMKLKGAAAHDHHAISPDTSNRKDGA
jgi:hypothetical protein